MATLTAVICLFTIQAVVLVDNAAADPNIDINPTESSLGISSALDINCTFSLKKHPDMAAIVSLSLLRANASGQNFEELAGITQFSPDSVNLVTQEKVTASGVLSQTGESFLKVTWDFPTASQGGVYQCAAHGLDMLAHNVESTNISVVTVHQADLNDNDVLKKLEQMETTMSSMGDIISSMENDIQSLEDTVSHLRSFTCTNNLEHFGTYNSIKYYLFRENFKDIKESATVCDLCGGTLIEIDDENEYNAVVRFLQNVDSDIIYVMIGGTDEQSEGNWILPSTNQTLPFTAWITGHPSYDTYSTSFNCVVLTRASSWQMFDTSCTSSPSFDGKRASCEIPPVRNTGHK